MDDHFAQTAGTYLPTPKGAGLSRPMKSVIMVSEGLVTTAVTKMVTVTDAAVYREDSLYIILAGVDVLLLVQCHLLCGYIRSPLTLVYPLQTFTNNSSICTTSTRNIQKANRRLLVKTRLPVNRRQTTHRHAFLLFHGPPS